MTNRIFVSLQIQTNLRVFEFAGVFFRRLVLRVLLLGGMRVCLAGVRVAVAAGTSQPRRSHHRFNGSLRRPDHDHWCTENPYIYPTHPAECGYPNLELSSGVELLQLFLSRVHVGEVSGFPGHPWVLQGLLRRQALLRVLDDQLFHLNTAESRRWFEKRRKRVLYLRDKKSKWCKQLGERLYIVMSGYSNVSVLGLTRSLAFRDTLSHQGETNSYSQFRMRLNMYWSPLSSKKGSKPHSLWKQTNKWRQKLWMTNKYVLRSSWLNDLLYI